MGCNDQFGGPTTGGQYIKPTINGGIVLDATTIQALVDYLCLPLGPCFEDAITDFFAQTRDTLAVRNLTVTERITITDPIAEALAGQMAQYLRDYILAQVNDGTFTNVTLREAIIKDSTLDTATLDRVYAYLTTDPRISGLALEVAKRLASTLNLDGLTLTGNTLNGASLNNPAISGGSIHMTSISESSLLNTTFNGQMSFNEAARQALLFAIESGVKAWISAESAALTVLINAERDARIAALLNINAILNAHSTELVRLSGIVDYLSKALDKLLECGGLGVPLVDCDGVAVPEGYAVVSCDLYNALLARVVALENP